jgi:cytochrome c peroxidase
MDNTNYSCAYDAFVSILYQLWCQDPHKWSEYFSNTSLTMQDLASSFQLVVMQETTFEQARNEVRETLHTKFDDIFPYGSKDTSVVDLALKVFHDDNINASTQLQCVNCQFADEPV